MIGPGSDKNCRFSNVGNCLGIVALDSNNKTYHELCLVNLLPVHWIKISVVFDDTEGHINVGRWYPLKWQRGASAKALSVSAAQFPQNTLY